MKLRLETYYLPQFFFVILLKLQRVIVVVALIKRKQFAFKRRPFLLSPFSSNSDSQAMASSPVYEPSEARFASRDTIERELVAEEVFLVQEVKFWLQLDK